MNRSHITPDQNAAIERLYDYDETFLIAPTGAGKSVIALSAISELLADGVLKRVLILAPLKVCLTTWTAEPDKWDQLSGLQIAVATGTPAERRAAIESGAQVVIVNEENAAWLFTEYETEKLFDGVLIDETSRWSQSGGVRYKKIRHKMKGFKWRVGMTAEPVSEDWVRLFGQILLLDLGKSLGRSKDRYLKKYFYSTDWEGRNWEVFPGRAKFIARKIRGLLHVMPDYKADSLPPKTVAVVPLDLPEEGWRRYNRLRIDSVLKVDGETLLAGSRAVLSQKLEQVAAGFSYTDDGKGKYEGGSRPWIGHHSVKTDWATKRAREILAAGESVIVVYWFQQELEILRAAFPYALEINGKPKAIQAAMAQWQSAPGQIMFLQPSSASHGVDGLQKTCFRQLWLGPVWGKDRTNQCQDRLWRRGVEFGVEIEVAVARGTVDEIKQESVVIKGDHHALFLRHLPPERLTLEERESLEAAF